MASGTPFISAAALAALALSLLLLAAPQPLEAGEVRPACSACEADLSHLGDVMEFSLDGGEHRSFSDNLDDLYHLRYNLSVLSGGPAKLHIMDKDNYQAFKDGSAYSVLHSADADASSPAEGLYETNFSGEHVVVVINEGQGSSELRLAANIDLEDDSGILLAAGAAIAAAALLAALLYRRSKGGCCSP